MKNKFIGFYDPTKEEIDSAWEKGVFAFDANSLLNLYRYTDKTRTDFLSALKTIKERLFLPFQSAYEYHNNRINVIETLENDFIKIFDLISDNFEKNLKDQINSFKKHPSIIIEDIIHLNNEFLKNLEKKLNKQKEKHIDFKTQDLVLEQITELFENAIGTEFSEVELQKIYEEGKIRYLNETPPGYKDFSNKQKKGSIHVYGDLIIWKELINYTQENKRQIVFITDDRKEDWWTIQKGKTIRPREELIKEFYEITGIRILIYNADTFLSYAKERGLLPKLKVQTIDEVKDIRVSDEDYYIKMRELIGQQDIITTKSISDLFSRQIITPISINELLNSQSIQILNPNKLISVPDILSSQIHLTKNFPSLTSNLIYTPQNLSSVLKNQNLYSENNPIENESNKKN